MMEIAQMFRIFQVFQSANKGKPRRLRPLAELDEAVSQVE